MDRPFPDDHADEHADEFPSASSDNFVDACAGDDDRNPVLVLTEFAERLDDLAATADLMGDEPTARIWRTKASEIRLRAMSRFDDDDR